MGILERSKTGKYESEFVADVKLQLGKDQLVIQDVLDYLFDEEWRCYDGPWVLSKYEGSDGTTLIQRINLLWVYPSLLIAAPFVYILKGRTGVSRKGKIGRVVDWLIKLD